jgi:hypothetical protein
MSHLNRVFNLTTTYTTDSDVFSGYNNGLGFHWERNLKFDETRDYSLGKKKLAYAIISNCGAKSNRMSYINGLQSKMSVDVFGRCGSPCPGDNCKESLASEYKFYLAFENAFCRDYITEKFFNTINLDVVVVAMGAGNYSHYVPKSAYIDIRDFKTSAELANYLLYLDGNATAYNSYFKWRRHVSFVHKPFPTNEMPNSVCDLCIFLHLEEHYGLRRRVVSDMDKYWSTDNCFMVNF